MCLRDKRARHNIMTTEGEVNNTDYLYIMAPVSGWNILGYIWQQVNQVEVREAGKMGKH